MPVLFSKYRQNGEEQPKEKDRQKRWHLEAAIAGHPRLPEILDGRKTMTVYAVLQIEVIEINLVNMVARS